ISFQRSGVVRCSSRGLNPALRSSALFQSRFKSRFFELNHVEESELKSDTLRFPQSHTPPLGSSSVLPKKLFTTSRFTSRQSIIAETTSEQSFKLVAFNFK